MPRWLIALILVVAVLTPVSLKLATAQPMLIGPGGQGAPEPSPGAEVPEPSELEKPVSPFTAVPPAVHAPPTSRPIIPSVEPIVIEGPSSVDPVPAPTPAPQVIPPAPRNAAGAVIAEPRRSATLNKSSLAGQQEIARQVGLQSTRRPTGNFIGVMGQIAQPGVFEYTTPFPYLIDVVRNAGGLTADASGSLRIVRQGRAGQQVYYSPKMRERLIPGDVVIVEGTDTGRGARHAPIRARRLETAADAAHSAANSEAVQIAFVNLIDRPVILKMRSEHATVSRIVGLLGQGPEVEQTVRVLKNGALQHRLTSSTALPDGSVLVFDPTVLMADRLPPLPGAYQPEEQAGVPDHVTSADATAAPVPTPASQATQPETGDGQPVRDHAGTVHGPVAAGQDSQRVTLLQPPTGAPSLNPTAPPARTAESPERNFFRTAELPSHPATTQRDKAAVPSDAPTQADQNKAIATTPGVNPISLPQEVIPGQAKAETGAGKGGNSNSWAIVLCLMGCMTAVGSFVVFWSKTRTAEPPPIATIPIESAPEQRLASRLDALINNELPVTEEPVRLNGKLQFFGRPQAPRKIRIDQAHSFNSREEEPAPAVEEQPQPVASREIPVGAEIPLRGMHRRPVAATEPATAAASQSKQQPVSENRSGLLGRALSTVHGASTR